MYFLCLISCLLVHQLHGMEVQGSQSFATRSCAFVDADDLESLKKMLDGESDVVARREMLNQRGLLGGTPLHHAASKGDLKGAEMLLNAGADVDAQDNTGATPLTYAVLSKNGMPMIQFLLQKGASPSASSKYASPLHAAVGKCSNDGALCELLSYNPCRTFEDYNGFIPLHKAAMDGTVMQCLLLLDKDTINVQDPRGDTALHLALKYENVATAGYLLDNEHIDIRVKNNYDQTALHAASCHGCFTIIERLLDKGLNVNDTDKYGTTPLHFAANGKSIEGMLLLLKRGALVNATDQEGMTPLHIAASCGYAVSVGVLLGAGALYNVVDKAGKLPLDHAKRALAAAEEFVDSGDAYRQARRDVVGLLSRLNNK